MIIITIGLLPPGTALFAENGLSGPGGDEDEVMNRNL
jgi:hypothetical protein